VIILTGAAAYLIADKKRDKSGGCHEDK